MRHVTHVNASCHTWMSRITRVQPLPAIHVTAGEWSFDRTALLSVKGISMRVSRSAVVRLFTSLLGGDVPPPLPKNDETHTDTDTLLDTTAHGKGGGGKGEEVGGVGGGGGEEYTWDLKLGGYEENFSESGGGGGGGEKGGRLGVRGCRGAPPPPPPWGGGGVPLPPPPPPGGDEAESFPPLDRAVSRVGASCSRRRWLNPRYREPLPLVVAIGGQRV